MTHDPAAARRDVQRRLELAGVPNPERDASALMDVVQRDCVPWDPLTDAQLATLQRLTQRRVQREPISHLRGYRAFWMHDFIVTPDVLDPRPETETLVELACDVPGTRVLDLGTGSGCILLSILHERPDMTGMGTDISEAALQVARRNAAIVGVADRATWLVCDWWSQVDGRFDLIVSNPPYIAEDEMAGLAPELSYEPRDALTDGADGLDAYRAIASKANQHLKSGGRLCVEIGPTQAAAVTGILASAGLSHIACTQDLDGRDRVVSGIYAL